MSPTLKIGAHEIGERTPCYVIAEIGHNHQGNLEKAREIAHADYGWDQLVAQLRPAVRV